MENTQKTPKLRMIHTNFNVSDLDKSIAFYEKALGLHEVRRKENKEKGFIIVFLSAEETNFELELTWLKDHPQKYDLGEGEFHLAFYAPDFEQVHEMHREMGCIVFENHDMGIYFIEDPDGYWLEILPHE